MHFCWHTVEFTLYLTCASPTDPEPIGLYEIVFSQQVHLSWMSFWLRVRTKLTKTFQSCTVLALFRKLKFHTKSLKQGAKVEWLMEVANLCERFCVPLSFGYSFPRSVNGKSAVEPVAPSFLKQYRYIQYIGSKVQFRIFIGI